MAVDGPWSKFQHGLANLLTFCNLTSGITAILLPGKRRTVHRSGLILLGALCDALDGPLARRSGNPTLIGARADGVSDVITCGVAPVAVLAGDAPPDRSPLIRAAPAFYLTAIAWRVARYGIGHRKSHVFRGLPVTGAGVLFAVGCQARLSPRALAYLALGLGVAMFSPVRVLSGEALVRREMEDLSISLPAEASARPE